MQPKPSQSPVPTGRSETREQRADRLWAELLQEVRVTQTACASLRDAGEEVISTGAK